MANASVRKFDNQCPDDLLSDAQSPPFRIMTSPCTACTTPNRTSSKHSNHSPVKQHLTRHGFMSQDWTSGPDRYQITQGAEPEWGWTRLFTFFAYAASKYHVLETTDAPLAQKASERVRLLHQRPPVGTGPCPRPRAAPGARFQPAKRNIVGRKSEVFMVHCACTAPHAPYSLGDSPEAHKAMFLSKRMTRAK